MSDSTTQPPVGIDLGTTYSVVAFLDPTDRPTTIVNQWGDLLTPSAVLADDGEIVVGREAIKGSTLTPQLFADCFKRDMGSPSFRKKIRGLDVPPEVLSAMVLDCLKQGIERRLGTVKQCVITVPAYFDESRRKATQDAGRLAGLDVLDIINEPTAAAVAFGYQQTHSLPAAGAPKQRVMVYDLGGGTFDVSVLEIDGDNFRTLATDGDVQLGGRDFDERLVNYFAEKFLAAHGSDPRNDPQDAAQLLIDARDTKHALTERQRAAAVVFHSGKRMKIDISRADFDNLTADLLGRTEMTSTQVVRESGLEWNDIDRVLLVGGSTRMPMVSAMLQRLSGKTADHSSSPDEVVAHGAALYCGLLMRKGKPKPGGKTFKLVNVNSHSLGVVGLDPQTKRRTNVVLIPKNTALPTHAVKTFRTAKDDQRSVQVTVVEGESLDPTGCITLGQCVLRNLPSGLKAGSVVEVKYAYGANGRIAVSARMPQSGVSMQVELEREQGRDLETLEAWKMRLRGLTPPQSEPGTRSIGGPTAAFAPGNPQAASSGADTVDLAPASVPSRTPTNPSAVPPSARPRPAPPSRSGGGSSPSNPVGSGPLPMRPPPPQPTPAPAPAAPMSPAYGQNPGMTPAAPGGYAPQGGSPYGSQPGYAPAPAAPAYGGGMPSAPMPGYGSPDPAQMSRRLDELFAAIGKAMAGQNTPPQFAGYQQAIAEANRDLMQAQQMFQSADLAARHAPPGTPEAQYRGQEVARAMQELGGRQARIDGALVSLGRACVDAGLQHQQLQNELTEILQLRAVLRR